MKKISKIIAVIFSLTLLFTSCSSAEPLDEQTAKTSAQKHIQFLVDGEWQKVIDECNDNVKKQIDSTGLETAWKQVTATAGGYINPYSEEYSTKDGLATVSTVLEFENTGVMASITYDKDGKIRGIWFNLAPIKTVVTETDNFAEKEITVGEYNLKGVVTLPKNIENYPVVVFVQGSGPSDYDETIGGNKPFKEMAHYFADNGIASVRINKRFFQNPELAKENVTIYDEYMDDIYAAIDWAKNNVSEDVYVIGHSLGAMSGPKIALDNGAKGLVMLAGTTRELEDVVYDQNIAILKINEEYSDKEKKKIEEAIAKGTKEVKELKEGDKKAVLGIPASYWLSLRDLDAENILKNKLDIPVLALQGEEDFQVYYEKDFIPMKEELKDKENISFISYEGLNHLFMPQTRPGAIDISEYAQENHIPENVLEDITNFILNK